MSAILSPDDEQRMRAILASVEAAHGPDEAAWLAMKLGQQPALRAARIERRDALVRQAIGRLGSVAATTAAKMLAKAIDRRMEMARPAIVRNNFQAPSNRASADALVDQIIELNGWKSLGWRQIHNIASG